MKSTLYVGDTVLCRGGFGNHAALPAKVRAIEKCAPGDKYGDDVQSLPWTQVPTCAVVDLDDGHWAYGWQITPF